MDSVDLFYNNLKEEGENIIAYKGVISEDIIKNILLNVEKEVERYGKKSLRKIFFISVELLQNIFHHSLKGIENGINLNTCFLILNIIDNNLFKISAGNFVNQDKFNKIASRIEQLNLMEDEELRDLYKKILTNQEFSEKGGGGLGMLDIRRKTGMPIDYKYILINKNLYFFNFSIFLTNKN